VTRSRGRRPRPPLRSARAVVPRACRSVSLRTEARRKCRYGRACPARSSASSKRGDAVKAGARLFLIRPARRSRSICSRARASLAQERARQDRRSRISSAEGLADRRAISQREADSGHRLKQAVAAVQLAEARVRQSELNLSYASVNAPIGGITGRAPAVDRQPGHARHGFELGSPPSRRPIRSGVRFALSERVRRLRGSTSEPEIKVELAGRQRLPRARQAEFLQLQRRFEPRHGADACRAAQSQAAVLPGQYVRVQVVAGTQQALVVPQSAVMQNEGGRFVWIVGAEGKAAQRQTRSAAGSARTGWCSRAEGGERSSWTTCCGCGPHGGQSCRKGLIGTKPQRQPCRASSSIGRFLPASSPIVIVLAGPGRGEAPRRRAVSEIAPPTVLITTTIPRQRRDARENRRRARSRSSSPASSA